MRDCKKCNRVLDFSNFYKEPRGLGVGGYRSTCKDCLNFIDRERRANDSLYKLRCNTRHSIREAIKRNNFNKKSKTSDILGCSFNDFKLYLESKFEPWMNWNNYGKYNGELNYGWDIDHIIPVSSAVNEEEIIKLNHYTNLQPLCSRINRDVKIDRLKSEEQ